MVTPNNEYTVYVDGSTYYAKDLITGDLQSNSGFIGLMTTLNTMFGSGGGKIRLRPGEYDIASGGFNFTNPVSIEGAGKGRTRLVRTAGVAWPTLIFSGGNTNLSQLTIDGNCISYPVSTGASEIQISGTGNIVRDVEVKNWNGAGGLNNHGELTVDTCWISGPNPNIAGKSQYGVLSYTDSTSTTIRNCNIQWCDLNAVFSYGRTIIRDTYMANNARVAGGNIGMVARADNDVGKQFCGVYGCTIETGLGGDSGIELANSDFECIGNKISGCNSSGIISDPSVPVGKCIMSKNIIRNCGYGAITIEYNNQKYFSITDNTLSDDQATPTQKYGVLIAHIGTPYTPIAADYYTIRNNILFGNTMAPWLDMGTGTHKTVRDNIIA